MDEDRLNIAIRKFLKEVGVTSQREIERVVHDGSLMISSYTREDWQDDPAIRNLEDVAMRLRDAGQEVPAPVIEAIQCAAAVR